MKSDYTLQAVKGIKKSFDNAAAKNLLTYKDSRLFMFEVNQEWSEIFTSTEGLSGSKELSEAETPPTLKLNDGRSVTLTNKRFGGGILVTEDDREKMKDDTTKIDTFLKRQRNQLLQDVRHLFLTNIFAMYNEAFDSTSDYLAPDSVELCGQHLDADDASWFDNSDTAELSSDAVDDLMEYGGAFQDPEGKPMPIDFNTIIVKKGSDAARTAKKLFAFGITPTQVSNINIYEGEMTIIETPYITAANKKYWFAYDSSIQLPLYVGISKMPSLNEPIRESNEAIRSNCTGYWKQGINNLPIGFYGSTGAGSGS
jgi:hypothetical protein